MCVFSVIVPIYNTPAEYLNECIKSCINQGVDDMEILLIDNGSEEYCKDICLRYEDMDSRVCYIRQDNQGVSVARNVGLENAKGDYIVFVDADDWIPDNFLSLIKPKLDEYGRPDILMYGYGSVYSNKGLTRLLPENKVKLLTNDQAIGAILDENKIFVPYDVGTLWAKVIKRSLIEENRIRFPVGVIRGQDAVFMLYLYHYCNTVSFLREVGYCYRKNDGSVSHRLNPDIIRIDEMKYAKYDDFLEVTHREKGSIIHNIRVKALLGEYLNLYFCHRDNKKPYRILRKEYLELIETDKYRAAIWDNDISGTIIRMKIHALKKKHVAWIWMMKKLETALKRMLIREYG